MVNQEDRVRIERLLAQIPAGELTVTKHPAAGEDRVLLAGQFSAQTVGKGRIDAYSVFPGIEVFYTDVLAPELDVHHSACPAVLELFSCHCGRVGWNMRGGTAIYLGAGDIAVHSAACCADSAMMFPLGYAQGISASIDLSRLEQDCPEILREAGFEPQKLRAVFCSGQPAVIPACAELEAIIAPLYSVRPELRIPYLKLKIQELLLYLMDVQIVQKRQPGCLSRQTELVKVIHRQLIDHPERRFTIEELSRQYLINASTLKEAFKAVYGLPIATYMKEYRVRQAMKLLRESDATIADIAAQVGYETQGKFTKAFKDVAQMLPKEYRQAYRADTRESRR